MSIYYKFKSLGKTIKEWDTVTFDGAVISVRELKNRIADQKHLDRTARDFDLLITNAETGEVYREDGYLIAKNTWVYVNRGSTVRPVSIKQQPRKPVNQDGSQTQPEQPSDQPAQVSDEFGAPVFSRTGAAQQAESDRLNQLYEEDRAIVQGAMKAAQASHDQMAFQRQKMFGRGRGGHMQQATKPPPGYVCHRCQVSGHWIWDCPTNGDPTFNPKGPRKPAPGVKGHNPAFLKPVEQPGAPLFVPEGSIFAPTAQPADKKGAGSGDAADELPAKYRCPLCKQAYRNCVAVPCCMISFCDECIRQHLLFGDTSACPECGEELSPEKLMVNKKLQESVDKYLADMGKTHSDVQETDAQGAKAESGERENEQAQAKVESRAQSPSGMKSESSALTSASFDNAPAQAEHDSMTSAPQPSSDLLAPSSASSSASASVSVSSASSSPSGPSSLTQTQTPPQSQPISLPLPQPLNQQQFSPNRSSSLASSLTQQQQQPTQLPMPTAVQMVQLRAPNPQPVQVIMDNMMPGMAAHAPVMVQQFGQPIPVTQQQRVFPSSSVQQLPQPMQTRPITQHIAHMAQPGSIQMRAANTGFPMQIQVAGGMAPVQMMWDGQQAVPFNSGAQMMPQPQARMMRVDMQGNVVGTAPDMFMPPPQGHIMSKEEFLAYQNRLKRQRQEVSGGSRDKESSGGDHERDKKRHRSSREGSSREGSRKRAHSRSPARPSSRATSGSPAREAKRERHSRSHSRTSGDSKRSHRSPSQRTRDKESGDRHRSEKDRSERRERSERSDKSERSGREKDDKSKSSSSSSSSHRSSSRRNDDKKEEERKRDRREESVADKDRSRSVRTDEKSSRSERSDRDRESERTKEKDGADRESRQVKDDKGKDRERSEVRRDRERDEKKSSTSTPSSSSSSKDGKRDKDKEREREKEKEKSSRSSHHHRSSHHTSSSSSHKKSETDKSGGDKEKSGEKREASKHHSHSHRHSHRSSTRDKDRKDKEKEKEKDSEKKEKTNGQEQSCGADAKDQKSGSGKAEQRTASTTASDIATSQ